jgi:hypothetical protein
MDGRRSPTWWSVALLATCQLGRLHHVVALHHALPQRLRHQLEFGQQRVVSRIRLELTQQLVLSCFKLFVTPLEGVTHDSQF